MSGDRFRFRFRCFWCCGCLSVGSVSDISDAVGVDAGVGAGAGAGDATNGSVGGNAASFVPKTNVSRVLSLGFSFLSARVSAPMISLNSRLYSFPEFFTD